MAWGCPGYAPGVCWGSVRLFDVRKKWPSQLPGVIEAVTFLSPNWRSLIKGHLTIPKKVTLNHPVFFLGNVENTLIYLICTVLYQTNLVYNMKTYWYNPVCNSRSILCDVKNLVCQECFTVKADFNKITRRKTNSSPLKIPEHLWSEDNSFPLGQTAYFQEQTCCEFQVRIPSRILEVAGGDCHTHMRRMYGIFTYIYHKFR